MCVYIYVHTHTHIYIYIYVCVCVCVCGCICMQIDFSYNIKIKQVIKMGIMNLTFNDVKRPKIDSYNPTDLSNFKVNRQ